jgi:threonine dehydratase
VPACPLNLANIEKAAQSIDPVFLHSPQYEDGTLNATLSRRVIVKVETANPIRSYAAAARAEVDANRRATAAEIGCPVFAS